MAYSSITKPSDYFNTKLYTGTGSSNAQTGIGFQPDFVWLKSRSAGWDHEWYDSVRGVGKSISSVTSNAEGNSPQGVTAFGTDGFTVGTRSGVNQSGQTYAAWNWIANGTGSSNTDGSITSTVSANTTSGFSIVTYTGTGSNATIGHGLGSTPKFIIIKCRSHTSSWMVYYGDNTNFLKLDTSVATEDLNTVWNDTSPTNSVFTIGTNNDVNVSGRTYVAYCFAEKSGYSKFGNYTGNGNANGSFVYTGFKPAFVLYKRTDSGADWHMYDNKRDVDNAVDKTLFPDISNAESAGDALDFLSNGFKQRNTGAEANASGGTYTYMAFAEEPLVANVGLSIPATAR